MERETTLSQSIRTADVNADYDAACKRILSEKIILAWIMKSSLAEYRDLDVKEIAAKYIEGEPTVGETPVHQDETNPRIKGSNTEDTSINEGTVTYDILFRAIAPSSGDPIALIINVEAQNDFNPGYPLLKRGIYYCGRMLSAQHGTEFANSHYEKVKKVYSIWVCMKPDKNWENTITRYSIQEENLVGDAHADIASYDLISLVMLCLGPAAGGGEADVLKLLDVLLSAEVEPRKKLQVMRDEFDIPMTQKFAEEVTEMCNLSKGVMEKGIEKGIEQGLEQGLAKGMEQGIEKGILRSVRAAMESLKVPAEQAMDILQVPSNERDTIRKALES